jgi:hypothetical protein
MLQKDIDALNDRFWSSPMTYSLREGETLVLSDEQMLVENQPDDDLDDTQLWTRWIINPGLSTQTSLGSDPTFAQYGTATFQIFIPKGLYTGPGNDLRDQFNKLFRRWRSADKKLLIDDLKSTSSEYKEKFHLINAMVMWHSKRRASGN